jgi:hypothetical protein
MKLAEKINFLQQLPIKARMRILWVSVAIIAVALIFIWINSLTNMVGKFNLSEITNLGPEAQKTEVSQYVTVESFEKYGNKIALYFRVANNTNNILSFSRPGDVTIVTDKKSQKVISMKKRQGTEFAKKVLSNTEEFGILEFDDPDTDNFKLSFDNLFFENDPEKLLTEIVAINLKGLGKPVELRQ